MGPCPIPHLLQQDYNKRIILRPHAQIKNQIKNPKIIWGFVRVKGLEPPRLSTLDPKSSAATNYAIPAKIVVQI
jgi:hypothetical protein